MPAQRPQNRDRHSGQSYQKRPQQQRTSLPLDPSHTVQRELFANDAGTFPVARLKGTSKHPTIFRKRIGHVDQVAKHGDLVKVLSDTDEIVGYGLWNPRAEASIRMLSWGNQLPTRAWWQATIDRAIQARQQLFELDSVTEAYRVVHAEGDGLPGIVADRYGDVLSIEVFSLGMYQRSQGFAQLLAESLEIPNWIIRTGPMTINQEGFVADGMQSGNVPERVIIQEHGARFEIHPFEGHKTGFFCDQRDNRLLLREFCAGKRVLDLCCYTGGFAINAALAGAESVIGIDLDEVAIKQAKRNANLNQARVKFVHADAFSYMRDMQRNGTQFDVVILDPPKLIRGRAELEEGKKKYYDFNQLASSIVAPGGILLTCSCSGLLSMTDFTLTVRAAIGTPSQQILFKTGAAPDHPIAGNCLETEYLKCLWMRM